MPERPFYHVEVPEPWVCRVCQVPLNQLDDGSWSHGKIAAAPDHVPQPVPPGTIKAVPICDFCSQRGVRWTFPAAAFDMGEVEWGSADDWAACTECHRLIEADDRDALIERIMTINPELASLEPLIARFAAAQLMDKFFTHRMGPPVPFEV